MIKVRRLTEFSVFESLTGDRERPGYTGAGVSEPTTLMHERSTSETMQSYPNEIKTTVAQTSHASTYVALSGKANLLPFAPVGVGLGGTRSGTDGSTLTRTGDARSSRK